MVIDFLVTIPIRDTDAQNVIQAFVNKRPYGAPVPADKVVDNAGNEIDNPITKENYVRVFNGESAIEFKGNEGLVKLSNETNLNIANQFKLINLHQIFTK